MTSRKDTAMDSIVQILIDHRELPTSSYHLTRRCRCGEVVGKSRDRAEVRRLVAEHQANLIRADLFRAAGGRS